jgi:hypothetical protein
VPPTRPTAPRKEYSKQAAVVEEAALSQPTTRRMQKEERSPQKEELPKPGDHTSKPSPMPSASAP